MRWDTVLTDTLLTDSELRWLREDSGSDEPIILESRLPDGWISAWVGRQLWEYNPMRSRWTQVKES